MKKILGIFGIVFLLMITALVTPTIGTEEVTTMEKEGLEWDVLIAIGRTKVCFQENVIFGFVLIGYNAG